LFTRLLNTRGSTITESMIALAVFASAAATVYPVFVETKKHTQTSDIKALCNNIVRGKLDEYRFGRIISPSQEAVASGRPQISMLSMPTFSATSMGYTTGAGLPSATPLASGGYIYAKVKYNRWFPFVCGDTSQAAVLASLPADQKNFGIRECVGSGTAGTEATPPSCETTADQRVQQQIPGFRLYVRMQLSTPWLIDSTKAAASDARFSNTCPNTGTADQPFYDFNGSGDGTRVTVTGVMDLPTNITQLGTISRNQPTDLICSASDVVRPEAFPVRYYLSSDGRIYNVNGTGQGGSRVGAWLFRSIYEQGFTFRSSNILSIAVHPRNLSVWVLKPGVLVRYGNCGGVPLDCNTTIANDGFSDQGDDNWPNVQEFAVLPSIKSVAVDFTSGAVYALAGDKWDMLQLTLNDDSPLRSTNSVSTTTKANTVAYGASVVKPVGRPSAYRLSGFFIDPSGSDSYISSRSSTPSIDGGITYSSAIYRATDSRLASPILRLPVNAISFSK